MSFSRDPQEALQEALDRGYRSVRFQQGKAVLDRELNLLADLASPQRLAEQYVGNGLPAGSDGFRIGDLDVAADDFTIAGGSCLVAGQEVRLAAPATYQNQPVKARVAALPGGASNVYLRVFLSTATPNEDAALSNDGPGDVGSVTTLRERVNWEVFVSVPAIDAPDHFLLAVIDTAANTVSDRRRTRLTTAAVRDDVDAAALDIDALGARVNVSLSAAGTLNANTVNSAQIVNNSVTFNELANGAVTNPKLAPLAVGEPNLANNAVSRRTVADGALSIAKLSPTPILNQQFSLPAAPGAGQFSETFVSIQFADEHAFYLISVRQVAPRQVVPAILPASFPITWTRRALALKPAGPGAFQHLHQLVLQNHSTTAQTVSCRVYRLAET